MTITAARPISSHTAPPACTPERHGENARTVERTGWSRTGASSPPCITGAAAAFPCPSARRECRRPHRTDRGRPDAARRDGNVHTLVVRTDQLENPLFDGGRKLLRKTASSNLFHVARLLSPVDPQPRSGRRTQSDVFRIEAAPGVSALLAISPGPGGRARTPVHGHHRHVSAADPGCDGDVAVVADAKAF